MKHLFNPFRPMNAMAYLVLLFLSLVATTLGICVVENLPGYGELPFELETGYIGVDKDETVQLFYYFIKSQNNAKEDPLMLWISGGPGCSSLGGIFFEIGPLEIDIDNYVGGLPHLVRSQHAWTEKISIIFLDAPVGTGFSYSKTPEGYAVNDTTFAEHTHEFLKKWLKENSNYAKSPLYLAGEGYTGKHVPIVIQKILNANEGNDGTTINIAGYVMGNPGTDETIDFNSKIPLAHRLAIISDDIYESANNNCNGQFHPAANNDVCVTEVGAINEIINQLNPTQILHPACNYLRTEQTNDGVNTIGRFEVNSRDLHISQTGLPPKQCDAYYQAICEIWANDASVQAALHVQEGTVPKWPYCNDTLNKDSMTKNVASVLNIHQNFTKTKLRGLIYSGDHDMSIPYIGTQKWIRSLNLTLEDAWRAWTVERETAGYTRKFSNDVYTLTYATVKGAGHFAAQFKAVCSAMIKRWMANKDL